MSWFCENGGGGVAGIAFVGSLCGSYNTNLNERQWSAAGTGFVSSAKNPSIRFLKLLLFSYCAIFSI